MFLKVREYFDDTNRDADVIDVTPEGAVLAVPRDAIPSKNFAWLEFLLGQNTTIKALGRVETVEHRDSAVVVKFVFKYMFPADRRVFLAFLSA